MCLGWLSHDLLYSWSARRRGCQHGPCSTDLGCSIFSCRAQRYIKVFLFPRMSIENTEGMVALSGLDLTLNRLSLQDLFTGRATDSLLGAPGCQRSGCHGPQVMREHNLFHCWRLPKLLAPILYQQFWQTTEIVLRYICQPESWHLTGGLMVP